MALKDPCTSLYKLADMAACPDVYHTQDYEALHRAKGTPVVIDNGSCTCKAGWAGEDKPRLVFRNAIARTRGKKGEADCVSIGNDITHVETVRSTLKTQFDRNVVSNFSCQEQILDHTFSHLGLGGDGCILHPVLVTEPLCNPSTSRSQMSELLFECYGVPSVAYGIDALFSAHHNIGIESGITDALIVSSGHQTTHILPVLGGQVDPTHCKRVNLGGLQTAGYLQRLLQLKFPALQLHITLSCAQQLLEHHSYVALDYREELKTWALPPHDKDYRVIQLPYNKAAVGGVVADAAREAKDQQRRERARQQLLKLNKQKREDKIAGLLKELNQHIGLQAQHDSCDGEEYQMLLEEAGHESEEGLARAIQQVETVLETEQDKLAALVRNLATDMTHHKRETEAISEEWLQSLKERRKELLESKRRREVKRAELGKRRSAASQKRMRIISSLGAEVAVKKGKQNEDTFGMDDSDWNVYRTIDKHAEDSDSEKEEMELGDIVKLLEKHDPSYMRGSSFGSSSPADLASCYQLVLGVERFRAPEITFQPPMVGVDQSGISETLEFVLQYFPPDVQQRLVQNVFVTGGNTLHQHFCERIEQDLRCMRPFLSTFQVTRAEDSVLDTWKGGGKWAWHNEEAFVSKAEYMENGAGFMKQHNMSNIPLTAT